MFPQYQVQVKTNFQIFYTYLKIETIKKYLTRLFQQGRKGRLRQLEKDFLHAKPETKH